MKILFISSMVPHSHVVSGILVIHNRIRLLAKRGHEISLAAFVSERDREHIHEVKPMLRDMQLLPKPEPNGGSLRQFLSPIPSDFRQMRSPAMHRLVGRMLTDSRYDVVVAEFTSMGQYFYHNPFLPAVRRVISCHSCYTTGARQKLKVDAWTPGIVPTYVDLMKLMRYEFDVLRSADHVVTLTPEEQVDLHHYAPDLRISVSPYGVGTAHYRPRPDITVEDCIMYTGFFEDVANQDAVNWFVGEIWPTLRAKHPDMKFYLVGRSPTEHMKELARRDKRIIVTGEVADLAEYLPRAKVYVCPVRFGKGLRGKVLQAMSAGVPVVSTSLGAEGIAAQNGQSIMLADTAHNMIENINLLLAEPTLRARLCLNGRQLATSRYSWDHCVDLFEEVLLRVAKG